MIYVVYFSTAGTPATGLSPTIDVYKKVSNGDDAGVAPTVYEIGGGFYRFTISDTTEERVVRVNSGGALSDADKYKVLQVTPQDDYLDAAISTRSTSASVWDYADRSITDKTDFVLSSQSMFDTLLHECRLENLYGNMKYAYLGNIWNGTLSSSISQDFTLPRSYDYISGTVHNDNRIYLLLHHKNESTGLFNTYVYKGGNSIYNNTYSYLGNLSDYTFQYWGEYNNAALISFNGYLWLLGLGYTYPKQVYRSSDGITWSTVSSNTLPAFFGNAIVFDNKMWYVGGFDDEWNVKDTVYSSTDGITWTLVGNMPGGRFYGALVAANSKMIFICGYDENWDGTDTVFYSSDGITWNSSTFPVSRMYMYGVSLTQFNPDVILAMTYDTNTADAADVYKGLYYYSTDAITWTAITEDAYSTYPYYQYAAMLPTAYTNVSSYVLLGGFVYGDSKTRKQYFNVYDINAVTEALPGSINEVTSTIALSAMTAINDNLSNIDVDIDPVNAFTETIVTSAMLNINANVDALEEYVGAATGDILLHFDDMVLDFYTEEIEATVDLKTALKIILACMVGKASGAETLTPTFKSLDDAKNRVTMAVDRKGNRTTVTLDLT